MKTKHTLFIASLLFVALSYTTEWEAKKQPSRDSYEYNFQQNLNAAMFAFQGLKFSDRRNSDSNEAHVSSALDYFPNASETTPIGLRLDTQAIVKILAQFRSE